MEAVARQSSRAVRSAVRTPLQVVPDRPQISMLHRTPFDVRCECQTCGAHAFARPGGKGICGNCHGTDLMPLHMLP